MSTKLVKSGYTMYARDENQLAAFLNSGWKISEIEGAEVAANAPVSISSDAVDTSEPAAPRQRRRRKTTS